MTDYILEISFDPEIEDVVHGILFLTRSTGNSSPREGVITAFFGTTADRDAAAAALRDLPVTLDFADRTRVDWLDRYQQSLTPLLIGRSFVIAPDESLLASDREHRLIIPQAQAFGTGSHESTALCIELLEEIDLRNASGLDIGCGSGILAYAMLRLGAKKVVAFDVDPDTIGAMRENRTRNALAASLFIGSIDALRGGVFDVITMNILPEIIVPLLPTLKEHVGGVLILSGILTTARGEVLRACGGWRPVNERQKGEWWAATFAR